MRKSKILIAMGICVVTLSFNGCGSQPSEASGILEVEKISDMNEMTEGNKKESLNSETKEEQDKADVGQYEKEGQSSESYADNISGKETDSIETENQGKDSTTISSSEQRSGVIEKVNDQYFIINKAYVDNIQDEKFGELDMMEFSPEEEKKELMSINYSDTTVFVVQTIKDGGNYVSQREGAVSDLEIGRIVTIDGTDNNGTFDAVKVVINIVI